MNPTIWRFQCVVSWTFCALAFGFLSVSFGQATLPPLESVHVPNFTIPFAIEESAISYRDVELLVSKDRGRRWQSAARQPVESGKFAFHAETDGEYWFAFRTITASGNMSPFTGHPHLRVSVNTQPDGSGPVTPPKPQRFRKEEPATGSRLTATNASDDTIAARSDSKGVEGDEADTSLVTASGLAIASGRHADRTVLFAPKLPGFELPEPGTTAPGNLLDDLLSGMSPFMDVQPVEIQQAPKIPDATADVSAGSIARIDLNNTAAKPQIIVQWHPGDDLWRDAQIDLFRGGTKSGPWSPIAINLKNSGEYWWFLTPEDLKPFYIAVRIRSLYGGIRMDVTQSAITIDPQLGERRQESGVR